MHETDDPNMPPPHLLQALSRHSTPTRLEPYVPRKLPNYVIDEICHRIALDQRATMLKSDDPNLPPRRLLLVLRKHGRNRPYCPRRLSRRQLSCLPLSRIVELGTADDIATAWRKRCRFRGSRPSLRTLLVLAASEAKRAGEDVRDIVAKLRQIEDRRSPLWLRPRPPVIAGEGRSTMMGTSFDEAMNAVEAMVKLRCKLDADLRHWWRPQNTWPVRRHGPEPGVTAEHAIYLVLRGVALLERDGVPAGKILRQLDTKLRLAVLPPRARKMPPVEDYLVSLLRKVAPGYLEHGPGLLAGAITLAREGLRTLPEDGVWSTPDGRPPPEWRFWRIPKARERREFWPLRKGVPLVPETRRDIDLADILIRKQPDDELWRWSSPSETWRFMMGGGGIALVRNGRVIADVVTRMN